MNKGKRVVKLALVQFESRLLDIRGNVEKACRMIREAGVQGADLVILPELFSTGYQLNVVGPKVNELAEPLDGPTVRALREAAASARSAVVAGMALLHDLPGVAYNSAVVIENDGSVAGCYDKQHLWALERFYFRAGADLPVFDLSLGRVGVLICYDLGFPEVSRMLALKGAELLVAPSAWCAEDMDVWDVNCPARALENTVFLAAVNRYGSEEGLVMPGHSRVCDPRGRDLAMLSDESEGILYAQIDLDEINGHRLSSPYLKDRRPELYDGVAAG